MADFVGGSLEPSSKATGKFFPAGVDLTLSRPLCPMGQGDPDFGGATWPDASEKPFAGVKASRVPVVLHVNASGGFRQQTPLRRLSAYGGRGLFGPDTN